MWKILCLTICSLFAFQNTKAGTQDFPPSTDKSGLYDELHGVNYAMNIGLNAFDPYAFHQLLTNQILAHQAAIQNQIQYQTYENIGSMPNVNDYDFRGDNVPNYVASSASIGPDGYYQTAYITPENPDTPNIVNRFGSVEPGGLKGVSVSAFSSSSNINGKQSNYREAQTTVNDGNGHISTYKVHS
ncbi:uncharacterized protein LOC119640528 isoform X2 [Glossina fuscipes]|uniref:Uncharacterized protein LOC119640528 isoform X2 n=1 Tax=Glossina fuscipes TaxID=7396 RepID=A0A9C5ZDJ2_9MUSC|nr:uncharacterized protein LOC119640528 isoform X2 [Glossina fuscipes]